MESNKLSMMDAYMIEALRSNGISNEEIIKYLEKKDFSSWENIKPKFDFKELLKLYEQDKSKYKSILVDGYTVKFLTMNGLKNLLKMKFNKVAEQDYEISDTGIHHLEIGSRNFTTLQQLLSMNWVLEEHPLMNNDSSKHVVSIQILR